MRLMDICNEIENANRRLVEANKLEAGIAFPNPGDFRTIEKDDVCKIDFGTHVNGLLVDCAFTVAFNPIYVSFWYSLIYLFQDNLLLAVKEATNTGIREAGIDARLNEIGEAI